ncbi:MAG: hypothetical protein ABIN67_12805 [Ferruginibacter sp.]
MKNNSMVRNVLFLVILLFSFLPQPTKAQGPTDPAGDPDLPIDGGVSILIAAGVGYGVKKYRDERKKLLNKTE